MKKLAAIILCFCVLLSFSACDGEEASAPVSSLPSSSLPDSSVESSSSEESSTAKPPKEEPSNHPVSSEPKEEEPVHSIHSEHYCYGRLNDLQKEYYEKLYEGVMKMQSSWIVLGLAEDSYRADIAVVRNALVSDHPEIFWLPTYYASSIGTSADERVAMIYFSTSSENAPSYIVGRGEMERKNREMTRVIDKIVSEITTTDPYEIELQLHDKLCLITDYSNDPADPFVYTSYGALVNGAANCEGYSRAMQLLLSRFGILSVPVSGTAKGEGHMWNAVLIDKDWYHLDVTWNDTVSGFISHEYFNLTDGGMAYDHILGKNLHELSAEELNGKLPAFNVARPVCSGTKDNYFARTGLIFGKEDLSVLADYLAGSISDALEIAVGDSELKKRISTDSAGFISEINSLIVEKHPESTVVLESVTLSYSVLRLYKNGFTV